VIFWPYATVQSETDRYIAQPAQALAYKIGEQTILELRGQAQSALGNQFDLADFHGRVLGEGSIPLDMLRARVKEWIADRAVNSKQESSYEWDSVPLVNAELVEMMRFVHTP
jgi:hypothetical protein